MMNDDNGIHTFNRFELKYVISGQQAQRFKEDLRRYVVPDQYGDSGRYALSSLYYDSPDLRCYQENDDGLKLRRKLRIRHYDTGEVFGDESPVCVEIKQRYDRVTQKRRTVMPYDQALRLCNDRQVPDRASADRALWEEIHVFLWRYNLLPASIVRYLRQAFMGTAYEQGLRVTFDTSLSFQTQQLHLHESAFGLPLLPASMVVMEIKVDERLPRWLADMLAAHNLQQGSISKYCRSIEVAHRIEMTRRHALRAECSRDVLASCPTTFHALEERMGIGQEQRTQEKQDTEVNHGHIQHH